MRKISLNPTGDSDNSDSEMGNRADGEEDEGPDFPLMDVSNGSLNKVEITGKPGSAQFGRPKVEGSSQKRLSLSGSPSNNNGIFVQLNILTDIGKTKYWKRAARWIKYEEVEVEGAERLGQPRIPTLSFQSLLSLQRLLETGVILLDIHEIDLQGIWLRVIEQIASNEHDELNEVFEDSTMQLFLLQHRRGYGSNRRSSFIFLGNRSAGGGSDGNLKSIYIDGRKKPGTLRRRSEVASPRTELRKNSTGLLPRVISEAEGGSHGWLQGGSNREAAALHRILIETETEATVVLVGKEESFQRPTIAFVRLAESIFLPGVTEVEVPVRFVVILLGPSSLSELEYKEIGRSISTLMSNPAFNSLASRASVPEIILQGISDFLEESIVLPPGDWDPSLFPYEELKEAKKVIRQRRKSTVSALGNVFTILEEGDSHGSGTQSDPFKRTNRPFGGLINDICQRYPAYWSDIRDGFNLQCLATIIFVYFGHVTGNIAFGGLMGQKTDNYIGIAETLVGAGVAGVTFALFSAQPLLLMGTTPPLMMFDESLYQLCQRYEMQGGEFLAVRTWIGLWMAIIALIFVCFEGSSLIKFFTRFTQEVFLTLISVVFIVESLSNLLRVFQLHPLTTTYGTCDKDEVMPSNSRPNVALLSFILMIGTYLIAMGVKEFRNSSYFNDRIRDTIGNFAVLFAIASMSSLDFYFKDTETRKLSLPDASQGLKTTLDNRTWVVHPFDESQGKFQSPFGYWIILLAILPALLLYILVFMESSISELMVAKKEMKLRKWDGFHLNILLICLINMGMGFFGSAWIAAPTIRSVTHASSLAIFSINNPPGEKPKILGVNEQRVSSLVVSILVGISVFMSDLLKLVPMAVLFGVFLYMGVTSLNGVQLVERIGLLFKPIEAYPEVPYVRKVRRWKMHLFTLVQLTCLVFLWGIKESPAALAMALLILILVPFRFCILKFWFNSVEMNALDGPSQGIDEDESELDMGIVN